MPSDLEIVQAYMVDEPVDMRAIFSDLGIEYIEEPISESGYIEHKDGRYKIVVNSNEGPQRRRFTAAHELAHYLMHRDLLSVSGRMNRHTDRLFGNGAKHNLEQPFNQQHEVQANRLAAQIIMPAGRITNLWDDGLRLDALAERFDVSKAAMQIRLDSLGLR